MDQAVIFYNSLLFIAEISSLSLLSRVKKNHFLPLFIILSLLFILLAIASALLNPVELFGKIQLLSWSFFVHLPLYLAGVACLCFKTKKLFSLSNGIFSIVICLVGIYAFFCEPHWIEITRTTIASSKIQRSVRVAVIADLQTEVVGTYEERVFKLVVSENPDVILFLGDYLQANTRSDYIQQKKNLNTLLHNSHLKPPLGMLAVRGNVEMDDWASLFKGLMFTTFDSSHSRDLGPIIITGLSLHDSFDQNLQVKSRDKFHIVLGHMPNFSLGPVNADLLLAGHTHGGQVKIPFFGSLFTLSKIPRSWASGLTALTPEKNLIVSRGLGMERGNAPKLRFNCRPELLIIDIIPSQRH